MENQHQTTKRLSNHPDFWNSSWNGADPDRIAEYIHSFDMGADEIITTLRQHGVKNICDAGCGCGIYTLKLAANGFMVSGFDISNHAVEISQALLEKAAYSADLKTASVLATGYMDEQFDCVISRDVLDHIGKTEAIAAVKELWRITRPGGIVIFTLDSLDEEYEAETHIVNSDGDYVFTDGKWNEMVFHPYNRDEVREIVPCGVMCEVSDNSGEFTVLLRKNGRDAISNTISAEQ